MEYSIYIDQNHSQQWGLTLSEAAIFSFCTKLASWATPIIIEGEVWYFASRTKVLEEMPIITDKADTIYRIYKALSEKGVIRWRKYQGKDCLQMTEKGKMWNSEKNPRNSENFPKNTQELGKFSEKTRKIFRKNSENFPTYHSTIDHNTIDHRECATPAQEGEYSQPTITSQPAPPPDSAPPPSPKRSRFAAPGLEEIISYMEDLAADPKWLPRFCANPDETGIRIHSYYESNGWKVGRNAMKDWKAACRNWLLNNEKYGKKNNVSGTKQPARIISEDTHRRALAITLSELGITSG